MKKCWYEYIVSDGRYMFCFDDGFWFGYEFHDESNENDSNDKVICNIRAGRFVYTVVVELAWVVHLD